MSLCPGQLYSYAKNELPVVALNTWEKSVFVLVNQTNKKFEKLQIRFLDCILLQFSCANSANLHKVFQHNINEKWQQ